MPHRLDLFRVIAEFTYDWESWIDVHGRLRWVNAAVERITGYSVAECLAMPDYPLPIVHPSDRHIIAALREEAAKGASGNDVEFRAVHKDGSTRWVAISFQSVQTGDDEALGYRTSVRDISERKRMEKELHVMRKRAEAAAVARAQLLANVSHELRSPLHCISGFGELLSVGQLDNVQRHYVEIIQDQCQSMLQQVEDLLELAALEAGGVRIVSEPFDLHGLVTRLADGLRPAALARGIALSCDLSGAPAWVEGDAHRLRQVLRNLLDNALKFTDRGRIEVAARRHHGSVTFEVRDSGVGMEQSEVERLLEPFQQGQTGGSRPHGGAGLGLNICQRLVHAMGGELHIQTEVGRGTTVAFTLALPEASAFAREPETDLSPAGTGCALVVDDSATARELMTEMLALLGWTSIEAESGEAALRVLTERDVDAILLDYHMPFADGAETAVALRRLLAARKLDRHVPIVLITANVFAREQFNHILLARGPARSEARGAVDAIIGKPLSRTSLAKLLRGIVAPSPLDGTSAQILDERVVNDLAATLGRDGKPLLERMLPRVAAEIESCLATLGAGAGEPEAMERTAHMLAGQAAILGARQLADAACALELSIKRGDMTDLAARVAELAACWARAERALSGQSPRA